MSRSSPPGGAPELPPDLPPEYAEEYLAGFRRAYDEARATLAAREPAGSPGASDADHRLEPQEQEVTENRTEAADDTRTFERVEPWAFEPPQTEQEAPEPDWTFEPPDETPQPEPAKQDQEWEFEPPPAPEHDHRDEEPPDDRERAIESAPEDQDWVVPGFAVREDARAAGVGPFASREASPQWIALAVLVCVAAAVLALLLVVIF